MANYRPQKVNHDLKRVISEIITNEIQDPNVPSMCSIMNVDCTKDLKHAKVYFSILVQDDKGKKAEVALNRAAGFIRHRLSEVMKTRSVPALKFIEDNSIQYSIDIAKKLDEINEKQDS